MTPYLLLAIGLLLIFLEFYMPGAVFGAIGALFIVASYITLIQQGAGSIEFLLFLCGSLVLLALLIRFALWRIPRAKRGSSIYLAGDQEGYVAAAYDKSAIGKVGRVLTDLKPGGFITLEGKTHAALSLSGYIEKGEEVKVIAGEGESLIVKRTKG
jgi:membrane-bound serine protease (ClpP class)